MKLPSNHVKAICLFSGGIDSTGMIYKMISEGYTVHIHHVIFDKHGMAGKQQKDFKAVQDVLKYFRTEDNFDFEISPWIDRFTYSKFSFHGCGAPFDHLLYAMMAACMVLPDHAPIEWDNHIRAIASGRIATENTTGGKRNMAKAMKLFKAATDNNVQWLMPMQHMCKRDIVKMLCDAGHKKLVGLTTSCWFPKKVNGEWVDCRNCLGCARLVEAIRQSECFDPLPINIINNKDEDEQHRYALRKGFVPPMHKYVDTRQMNSLLGVE